MFSVGADSALRIWRQGDEVRLQWVPHVTIASWPGKSMLDTWLRSNSRTTTPARAIPHEPGATNILYVGHVASTPDGAANGMVPEDASGPRHRPGRWAGQRRMRRCILRRASLKRCGSTASGWPRPPTRPSSATANAIRPPTRVLRDQIHRQLPTLSETTGIPCPGPLGCCSHCVS